MVSRRQLIRGLATLFTTVTEAQHGRRATFVNELIV